MAKKQLKSRKRQPNDRWLKRRIVQAVEYVVTGDVYFIAGYAMFALLWSGLGWPLFWAKMSANLFGWLINYELQRYWVFGRGVRPTKHVRMTRRYMLITLVDFILDYLIVANLQLRLNISPYIGQFISAGFFTFWNYAWYRLWVFPAKKQGSTHGRV